MIRYRRCAGLCSLLLSCMGTIACSDDPKPSGHGFGGSNSGGTAGQAHAGSKSGAGSSAAAGTESGEAGSDATGGTFGTGGTAGTAGSAGMAGSGGGEPTCATNCNDNNPCTDDACEDDLC